VFELERLPRRSGRLAVRSKEPLGIRPSGPRLPRRSIAYASAMGDAGLPELVVDWAQVIGSVLSLLALIVAMYALWKQKRDLAAERRRLHELESLRKIGDLLEPEGKVNKGALSVQLKLLPLTELPMTQCAVFDHYLGLTAFSGPRELLEQLLQTFSGEYREYKASYDRLTKRDPDHTWPLDWSNEDAAQLRKLLSDRAVIIRDFVLDRDLATVDLQHEIRRFYSYERFRYRRRLLLFSWLGRRTEELLYAQSLVDFVDTLHPNIPTRLVRLEVAKAIEERTVG
jgi:hypothetical protein